jgi:hypothetical protein
MKTMTKSGNGSDFLRMNRKLLIFMALVCWAGILGGPSAVAQGTAFTYQGQLTDAAHPANGLYDLQFGLYDAASGGNQQGGYVTNSATAVSNGLFTVLMDFGNEFPGAARWLEIGVRTNGPGAFAILAPRQALSATPYAITAGTAGTTATATLADSVVAGAVGSAQLAPGAAAANLNASGQAGVASGGLVLSASAQNTGLAAAGYVNIGATTLNEDWLAGSTNGAPSARYDHTAVWTGSEMIVWGGQAPASLFYFDDGGLYNPAANTWSPVTTNGAPSGRYNHTAVWTGSQMIV